MFRIIKAAKRTFSHTSPRDNMQVYSITLYTRSKKIASIFLKIVIAVENKLQIVSIRQEATASAIGFFLS